MEIEELQGARRKQDKEVEALNERIEVLQAENSKALRSKKKIQEEVRKRYSVTDSVLSFKTAEGM